MYTQVWLLYIRSCIYVYNVYAVVYTYIMDTQVSLGALMNDALRYRYTLDTPVQCIRRYR